MCILAVSRLGEVRAFLESAAGSTGDEWGSAAARLSALKLPDPSGRPSRGAAGGAGSDPSSGPHSVLFVQVAAAVAPSPSPAPSPSRPHRSPSAPHAPRAEPTRGRARVQALRAHASAMLAVADESHVLFFSVTVRLQSAAGDGRQQQPLRVQAPPAPPLFCSPYGSPYCSFTAPAFQPRPPPRALSANALWRGRGRGTSRGRPSDAGVGGAGRAGPLRREGDTVGTKVGATVGRWGGASGGLGGKARRGGSLEAASAGRGGDSPGGRGQVC